MLTLIAPGLIWTRQALSDLTCDLPLPAFGILLGRGRLNRRAPLCTADALAQASGLATPLPAAALRRLALGNETDTAAGSEAWLCLDPVRLHFAERSVVVDDLRSHPLTDDEASALAVSLAPTFMPLGQLEVIAGGLWNLRLSVTAPAFRALPDAAGRAASPLPPDPAYTPWRQALNDAQMILHDHPVNRAREAAGQPAVNSLWPWGGGRLPARPACAHDLLCGGDAVARGIARLLQIDGGPLTSGFSGISARQPLVIFDAMEQPARSGDAMAWRDHLARFDTEWLTPALDALRLGRLDALRLIAPGEPGSAELTLHRRDVWKFWRQPRALAELAPQ